MSTCGRTCLASVYRCIPLPILLPAWRYAMAKQERFITILVRTNVPRSRESRTPDTDRTNPVKRVYTDALTPSQRSSIGNYWNSLHPLISGQYDKRGKYRPFATYPLSEWEGVVIDGWELETDEDTIFEYAIEGLLDFDDMYREE
jgi:hypothetical protein